MSCSVPIVNVLLPGGTETFALGDEALGDGEPDGEANAGLATMAPTAATATPAKMARIRRARGDVFIGSSVGWPGAARYRAWHAEQQHRTADRTGRARRPGDARSRDHRRLRVDAGCVGPPIPAVRQRRTRPLRPDDGALDQPPRCAVCRDGRAPATD